MNDKYVKSMVILRVCVATSKANNTLTIIDLDFFMVHVMVIVCMCWVFWVFGKLGFVYLSGLCCVCSRGYVALLSLRRQRDENTPWDDAHITPRFVAFMGRVTT